MITRQLLFLVAVACFCLQPSLAVAQTPTTGQVPMPHWTVTYLYPLITPLILLISTKLAFTVYLQNQTDKKLDRDLSERQKKTDRAIALFQHLMTSEFMVRARLISCEYLLETNAGNKRYELLRGKNYEEIEEFARVTGDPDLPNARFYIRAVPNFFHSVHLEREHGYLLENELIFSERYAWYWVNVMEERCRDLNSDEMFTEHKWMRRDSDVERFREDKLCRKRHRDAPPAQ